MKEALTILSYLRLLVLRRSDEVEVWAVRQFIKELKVENEGLQTILALLQGVIANEGSAHWASARMHISKLKCFDGTQDAKEIENCFKVARVEEEAKVATMHLVEALTW
ncbi:hypothetical protein AAC387_Pa07g1255 [Persea americana]